MNLEEIKETEAWILYEKGRNFLRMMDVYTDTDKNYRFYNGNQWGKAKLGDVEPVQKNFIKPIVKYKLGIIHDNLFAINFSSQNFENKDFREEAERVCELLNKKAAKIWERDKMDKKSREITKDAAINDEGVLYSYYDDETQEPTNEVIKKNDIYFGNENDEEIQSQPYILIRKRASVSMAREIAKKNGVSEEKIKDIVGDLDNFEESGEDAKHELDVMTTIVTKLWKENGEVHFSKSTRYVDLVEDENTHLSLYPVAHFLWESKEGWSRGEGEVRFLIPNQIEVNRTEARRVIAVKYQAYPQKIANLSKITNPSALNQVGGIIKVNQQNVDDVAKIISTLPPATMSPDVKMLQEDLINVTRELAGAGDVATGSVNPEQASGKAILAVQQASQAPMTEQREMFKAFIEDVARIWLDILITYNQDGMTLEEEVKQPDGSSQVQPYKVAQKTLNELKASVKVDITPRGAFDKYAQEQSIENMFSNGMFNIQRLQELKIYVQLLDDDSVMPKQKLEEAIELMEKEQQRIAMIESQAQQMQMRAQQFLDGDPESQASQIAEAQQTISEGE